jgi:hypothetical protein
MYVLVQNAGVYLLCPCTFASIGILAQEDCPVENAGFEM